MADSFRDHPTMTSPPPGGPVAGAWNEMTDSCGQIRTHWQSVAPAIQRWTADERAANAAAAARMIKDLGTTFNVFSDAGGACQPYELDPIPLLIPAAEWSRISDGIAQRIRLLDTVLADLYGPQILLQQGLVPPDLVHSSPAFLPYACGVQPPGGRFLVTSGCDLVRNPSGSWAVLRDHTAPPAGLGQVLENRNVISNLIPSLFESSKVARLGDFLELEAATLRDLPPKTRNQSNTVFLTPGFRHPLYFEHAYKARAMGFPLVEPADLTVRERRLFLKTLAGLRRVDGVVCRIQEDTIDPLEHWGGNSEGIPGIIEAWRTGNVAIANAPGSGLAASPALMPFLPRICREWLGENLILPFVETWWLGQAEIRRQVLETLHRYVLMAAAPGIHPLLPIRCSGLSPAARRRWITTIEQSPHDFVVQLDLRPSESPSLESRTIRQRPVIWRTFALNAHKHPVVLPGGLARVGKSNAPPQLWPEHSGFTKDVWIPATRHHEPGAPPASQLTPPAPSRHSLAPEVPSRIAEQLFWVGRYAERIELATRLLRVTLHSLAGEAGRLQHPQLAVCLTLVSGCGLLPEGIVIHPSGTLKTLASLIHDPASPAGIPALTRSLLLNAAAARDRLSDDTWRFFNRLESLVHPPPFPPGPSDLLRTLDTLVLHLAAFAGMQAENMTRGHGWRFLETGRRIERTLGALAMLRTATDPVNSHLPLLDPLLEACDSVMTYRRRHFSRPHADAVIDLIFFDPSNPRSAAYQIHVIDAEIPRLPGRPDFGLMPEIRRHSASLRARFDDPTLPSADELASLAGSLEHFSDLLTQHFFSHSVRRVY
jgi:uncharacterized circularly permuted ATP-grasp superfamily protein/uncharacterized alpha-E superfamily protein